MAFLAILGGAVGLGFLWFFGSIWSGYVLTILWHWFVVPTFQLPELTIFPAIGIAMVVSYLTYQSPPDVEEKSSPLAKR